MTASTLAPGLDRFIESRTVASQAGRNARDKCARPTASCCERLCVGLAKGAPRFPRCFGVDLEITELAHQVEVLNCLEKAASLLESALEVSRSLRVDDAL